LEYSDQDVEKILAKTDVAVLGRGAGTHHNNVIRKLQGDGIKVVYDLDDNYMDIHPWSPHYKDLGVMPVNMEHEDGRMAKFWEDGKAGFDVSRNRRTRRAFPETIMLSDCVTVTTEPLRKTYKRFHDKVYIVPNAIDFRLWDGPPIRHVEDKVRILYTGAANHQEDFLFVREPLTELQKKHDNVVIVFVGADWKHLRNELDYSRVEVHEWVDFEAYPHFIRSLACHIGIAPITEDNFNDCRSELKWMEYSSLKMATVATNYGPYKRAIKEGETGLLVKGQEDWFNAMSLLVEDEKLRTHLAKNAYREVKRNHNLDYTINLWMNVFEDITNNKEKK
jgi:glycosyltransferase involved in cell wall biosynthesis